ncbi:hypothetical protein RHGRI_033845 [Rhododendron griersonianum]|uniref:Uncharacterized protein n=1 Tax=Rhododendron griersonianum TaxID=479676 RepID=A0AAV6HY96_9ERIC|nr:hypothetical protein RHGRI_033845 [Rhododendron griersonianum]
MLSSTVENIPIGSLVSLPACGAHVFSYFAEKCWVSLALKAESKVELVLRSEDAHPSQAASIGAEQLSHIQLHVEWQEGGSCCEEKGLFAGQMPQTVAKQEKKEELVRQEGTFNSFEAM